MANTVVYMLTDTDTIDVLLDDLDTLGKVSRLLNKKEPEVLNWRNLAEECDISRDVYESLEEDCPESPTKLTISYISNNNPQLTVEDLFVAIALIDRKDVLRKLKVYFKGEHAI